jgi:pyruvate/2-oxoglutarate dehydrogenase complex dihydrolipoamide acyltransferase (E2) component
MAVAITMPKFGQTMTEGSIVSWEKKVGEQIGKGEVFLKIESDKAVLDVEAEYSGTLLKIVAKEGDLIPCGQTIAYIGEPGEQV